MTPTETQIAQCETKFFDYARLYGYEKSIGIMSRQYSTPELQQVWKATQTQTKTKGPQVSDNAATAHKTDPEAIKNASRYQHLHINTGA